MAALEEMGYLDKPHTSAGRVPSSKGYRFYIDTIMKEYQLTPKEKALIDDNLKDDVTKFEELIKEASSILSRITNYASLVAGPQNDACCVEDI